MLWTGAHDGSLNGHAVNATVSPTATIVSGASKTPVALSSINPGDLVGVVATGLGQDLSTLTVTQIHVFCDCHFVGGTISNVTADSITLSVSKTGPVPTPSSTGSP